MQSAFPRDAKAPTIARFNNDNSQPVVTMALLSPTRSARELSILGDQVVGKRLQRVEGVAHGRRSAAWPMREVRIDLDPARLRAYGVTPAEIATALREANADQPVGLLSERHAGRDPARRRPRARPASSSPTWWWRTAAAWR